MDCVSGGRLIAGFVFGTPMDSVFAYGTPPVELRDRFHEARKLIERALARARTLRLQRQVHQAALRQHLAAAGPAEAAGLGARLGQPGDLGPRDRRGLLLRPPIVLGPALGPPAGQAYWDYCEQRGYMNPHRMAFTQLICCAETDAEAEAKYYDAVRYFYRNNTLDPGFTSPPGYTSVRSAQEMAKRLTGARRTFARGSRPRPEGRDVVLGVRREGLHHRRHARAGAPAGRELATPSCASAEPIACLHMGDLSEETAAMNTRLFDAGHPAPARPLGRPARQLDAGDQPAAHRRRGRRQVRPQPGARPMKAVREKQGPFDVRLWSGGSGPPLL